MNLVSLFAFIGTVVFALLAAASIKREDCSVWSLHMSLAIIFLVLGWLAFE